MNGSSGGASDYSADDAAARALLSRTSTFVSKPVPVPGGGAVDLSTLDPAALKVLIEANPAAVEFEDAYGCKPRDLAANAVKSMLK